MNYIRLPDIINDLTNSQWKNNNMNKEIEQLENTIKELKEKVQQLDKINKLKKEITKLEEDVKKLESRQILPETIYIPYIKYCQIHQYNMLSPTKCVYCGYVPYNAYPWHNPIISYTANIATNNITLGSTKINSIPGSEISGYSGTINWGKEDAQSN